MRHFFPIASRNTKNMQWKRFFYRMMCEDDGFVMCSTPVCTHAAISISVSAMKAVRAGWPLGVAS